MIVGPGGFAWIRFALSSKYARAARVVFAEFVKSSVRTEDCPSDGFPEFALVSRSNVGKSSLLDSIVRRNRLPSLLRNLFLLLIDASIPAKKIDLEYASWLGQNQIPITLIFTECDKRKKKKNGGKRPEENVSDFQELVCGFFQPVPPWIVTSSVTIQGRDKDAIAHGSVTELLAETLKRRELRL
ncbi:hypothetical protein PTKIN_Ptkin03bG0195500 [Pterospermum kingtungense]